MAVRTVRYGLTMVLLTFVYFETGWATTMAIALWSVAIELAAGATS